MFEEHWRLTGAGVTKMSKLGGKRRGGHSSKRASGRSGAFGGLIIVFVGIGVAYILLKVF